ncbi:MAG TPA: hypothetical protein VGN86_17325 [Pyrinomonadaceae bacterium]|nr:hypothetical protein [Pyrinomonadaceae bacterium]
MRLKTQELYARGRGDYLGATLAAHHLVIGEITFGHLYLTSEDYTLAWPGNNEEYPYASDNAAHFIIKQLETDKKELGLILTSYDTRVRLRIGNAIREFNFQKSFEVKDFQEVEPMLGESVFARYDFNCNFDGLRADFAFSAENPQAESNDNGEMAVRLPRTHPLTKWALQWIIDKHISSKKLKRDLHDNAVLGKVYHALMKMALTEPIWENG